MVSRQTIKDYGFNSIEQYFEHILKSLINRQRKQAIELAKKLSTAQKVDAVEYLESYVTNYANECKNIILNTI
ncbi:hypothetical protein [Aquimarina longa]|uniref:hypothetical protein n=1 Tax=Aquimarina longa TaxID=1080221 RepID=UPI0007862670|nr:hypothetical protein [Aquimarina longa]